MGNVGVANTKSGDYLFFSISSVASWPFTHGIMVDACSVFHHPQIFANSCV